MITSVSIGWFGDSFTVIPSYIIKDELVDKAGLLAYIAIRSYIGNDDMSCHPSIPSLAKRVRVSENTIRAGISVLIKQGYVVVDTRFTSDGDRTSNLYRLLSQPVLNHGGVVSEPPPFKNDRGTITNEVEPSKNIAFESFWSVYPRKAEKKRALKCYLTTRKQGATDADLLTAATNYARHVVKERTEPKYVKHPATFLGPSEPWRDWLVARVEKVETTAKASVRGWTCPKGHLNTHTGSMCTHPECEKEMMGL